MCIDKFIDGHGGFLLVSGTDSHEGLPYKAMRWVTRPSATAVVNGASSAESISGALIHIILKL